MTKIDLPKEFVAFEELTFCSNILQNCKIPIVIDDRPILLVGKGEQPQIWLWGVIDQKTKALLQVIKANCNMVFTSSIKVESENDSTCVKLKDTIIIKAVKLSDEKATIEQIDMRPLGFNIYGNSSTLNVGTNVMVGNRIVGGRAFIALGL